MGEQFFIFFVAHRGALFCMHLVALFTETRRETENINLTLICILHMHPQSQVIFHTMLT